RHGRPNYCRLKSPCPFSGLAAMPPSGEPLAKWGPSIVGFGAHDWVTADGRATPWPIALSRHGPPHWWSTSCPPPPPGVEGALRRPLAEPPAKRLRERPGDAASGARAISV